MHFVGGCSPQELISRPHSGGVYVTDAEDVALWLNASKHLQILVNKSAKKQMIHKIDTVVSALQGPLCQDGYVLSA